ncbi:MAG: synthase subunit [Haloplasmataceae bacterium]|jgi:F-type H+-transporting ATPase subunit b|nr:synthase subunit [Haloplasmataceae bacterium]
MAELGKKIGDLVQGGLFPNLITFFTQILATLILFYFLKKLVWKPVQEMLAKRSEVIVAELESAKAAKFEAEAMKAEYENDLKNAKAEANKMMENARIQALESKTLIIQEAEKEAAYKVEKATKEINLERDKAAKALKAHVVDIAFIAAEKLVHENLDDKKNRQLIDKFIEEVGE